MLIYARVIRDFKPLAWTLKCRTANKGLQISDKNEFVKWVVNLKEDVHPREAICSFTILQCIRNGKD